MVLFPVSGDVHHALASTLMFGVNRALDVTVFPKPVMVGTGPGPEWVNVYYVKLSHCNLCGNLNGSYTLALYQSQSHRTSI